MSKGCHQQESEETQNYAPFFFSSLDSSDKNHCSVKEYFISCRMARKFMLLLCLALKTKAEFLNVSENWGGIGMVGGMQQQQHLNIQIGSYRAWNGPEWRS